MKAIRAHEWCEPSGLTLDEIDRPEPGPEEVLIKVESVALNFPDILLIAGKYQIKPQLPFSPGLEVAGTVERTGESVAAFSSGQRVLAQVGVGGMAEFAVAHQASVHLVPDAMSNDEAAAFPLVYQTSYFGIAYRGAMAPGETVLVHSAAGGVGIAAVQIARAMGAGKIIGTAGSDEKLEVVRQCGADVAINYETQDFVDIVKKETRGRGADVIYDPVGGDIGERSTKCVAFEGRIVIIGFTSGRFPSFVGNHVLIKNYSVVGLHWGAYRQHNPAKVVQGWNELMALYEKGGLKPVIGGRYQMTQAAEALEFLGSRKAVGKIVLHW